MVKHLWSRLFMLVLSEKKSSRWKCFRISFWRKHLLLSFLLCVLPCLILSFQLDWKPLILNQYKSWLLFLISIYSLQTKFKDSVVISQMLSSFLGSIQFTALNVVCRVRKFLAYARILLSIENNIIATFNLTQKVWQYFKIWLS